MRNIKADLEEVIRLNIEDSRKLCEAARQSNDLDTLGKALEDLQKWQEEAEVMGIK